MKKPYKRLILLLIFGITTTLFSQSYADVYRWDKACEKQTLVIENMTANHQVFWLQKWNQTLNDETDYVIQPKSMTVIELKNDLQNLAQDYSLLVTDNQLKNDIDFKLHLKCFNQDDENNSQILKAHFHEGGVLNYKTLQSKNILIKIKNLSPEVNEVYIEEIDKNLKNRSKKTISVEPRQNYHFQLNLQKNTAYLKIYAQKKFIAFLQSDKHEIEPYAVEPQKTTVDQNAKYFLLAPRHVSNIDSSKEDQFVVKITDSLMISKARDQIRDKSLEKIVFGKIALGHQGFNRNFSKKSKPLWNWSVTEVTNISDFGSTACNGFPQLLEDRSEFWVNDPGKICFWNYRIKKELTREEVEQQ